MTQWQPPQPETPVYIIGDIHGCADKLARLLDRIDKDGPSGPSAPPHIVFIGDYVDRGDSSAEIVAFLYDLQSEHSDNVTCLAGNHEAMMLSFIDDPRGRAKRWLQFGGVETLESYGIAPPKSQTAPSSGDLKKAAADLRDAIGAEKLTWLQNLPLSWSSGNLWAVHAGADPLLPMALQETRCMLWGHPAFFSTPRDDAQWVAVGHTVVKQPGAQDGRITTDTGAVYGKDLTAARVTPDGDITFLSS